MAEETKKSATAKTTAKKAVIVSGGKQYLVSPGMELQIDKLSADKPSSRLSRLSADADTGEDTRKLTTGKKADFDALMLIDGDKVSIGTPTVSSVRVSAEIIEPEVKADKVVAIRFKAKKRVHKRRGHRQTLTRIKITKIA